MSMNTTEFRKYGKDIIDVVSDYWDTIRKREPLPDVQPGFMRPLIPYDPPMEGQPWEEIFKDLEKVAIGGNTHWQHPNFYAYYPTTCSYQAIMGDILSGGLASIGFSWKSSPSMTELEICVLEWLAKALALPKELHGESSIAIIQNTASDATYVAILAARGRVTERIKVQEKAVEYHEKETVITDDGVDIGNLYHYPYHDPSIMTKLVAYCSDQAHSSVEKGVMLAAVRLRKLRSVRGGLFDNFCVTPEVLEAAIKTDRANGLIPFIFIMTLGTTSTCAFDPLGELGPICQKEGIWVHIDSAYAGSFMLCPEYRYIGNGLKYVDSFNMNAHKTLQINFDCSPMWFKDGLHALRYFELNPLYLKYDHQSSAYDYRSVHLAEYFEELLREDGLFELFVPRLLGLVCFRIKNSTNEMNELLNHRLDEDRRIHLVASAVHGTYFLRLVICSPLTTRQDVAYAYSVIKEVTEEILKDSRLLETPN